LKAFDEIKRMKRYMIAALWAVFSFPAFAQDSLPTYPQRGAVPCTNDGPALRAELETVYGETRMLSTSNGGTALDIWTNPNTGSWTIVLYRVDGTACVPLSGAGDWVRHVQGRGI
jgi:hypothetical protein